MNALALGAVTVLIAGCKLDGAEIDDYYAPTAHYERHPIIVTKTGAHAKRCGTWPEDLTETADNEPYANFGCSQQNNIAAMVANPEDLVRPRATAPADAMRRVKVFDNYRSGEAVASAEEKNQDVKISDAAK
ncbi:CpaD family pilus assembly lipoprotein [Taklimakanibacter lacteus]|uniref:CpaD family pilus assembly lipoprotein n=1 Tax=Taklimakanibacter lacteus TaxID=2268456 RepID=UPI0034D432ED